MMAIITPAEAIIAKTNKIAFRILLVSFDSPDILFGGIYSINI